LQAVDEKRYINLDAKLLKLFGPMAPEGRIYFPNIPEMMNRFLEPVEPIVLNYVVRVDKASSSLPPQYYDLDLSLDHPIRTRMNYIKESTAPNVNLPPAAPAAQIALQISQYDDQIASMIAQLKLNCEKVRFLRGFAEQPTLVMKRWIDQQQRSLDQILATEEVEEDSASESEEEIVEELDEDEFARTIAGLQTSLSRRRGKKRWSGPEVDEAVGLFLAQPLEAGGIAGQTRPV
jgi:SWI/SNF-related matrix-associated actin-dependent regulator of chromatin subfamily D